MLKEITRKEFIEKFGMAEDHSDWYSGQITYLEDGTILLDREWNGECYTLQDGSIIRPVYGGEDECGDIEILGYERM